MDNLQYPTSILGTKKELLAPLALRMALELYIYNLEIDYNYQKVWIPVPSLLITKWQSEIVNFTCRWAVILVIGNKNLFRTSMPK